MNKDRNRGLFHAVCTCAFEDPFNVATASIVRGQNEQVKAGRSMTVTGVCFKTCCEGEYSTAKSDLCPREIPAGTHAT